ncbi:Ppx/GppA phosphatase family protein [Fusibacter ferrireducens]|uniref:Ppx/GppA family phosphatase n=1 Tax=Fusibacter ferrireducens TaxID=2785058 RepID=A0ABR9ZYU1_9FIRM|nr:Ppx/GppA phosphatase family protein [Fusibacter ferrireducens]MBF4695617.1 Ppx/GppA family phosphatase [Fusibacter ferrireducens]
MKNRYASIDVGTNSIRCLMAKIENGQLVEAEKKLEMTRIGEGVNATKMLQPERILSSTNAIKKFVDEAKAFLAQDIFIMATSAVRDAENRAVFLNSVKEATGYDVDVISGKQEADIGFKGVIAGAIAPERMKLVVDIGGGSTEFIVGNIEGIAFSKSINIGAVRMTNMFGRDYSAMSDFIDEQLKPIVPFISDGKTFDVIGIGGTATTFLTMFKKIEHYKRELVHNQMITCRDIEVINKQLRGLTLEEKKNLPGLDPKRADIIEAGGVILSRVMHWARSENMIISDYDNLEGYLFYCLENPQNRR